MNELYSAVAKLNATIDIEIKRYLFLAIASVGCLNTYSQDGRQVYQSYCIGCHGPQLEGSVASALIKDQWEHGGDKQSIINTITNGIEGTEMISWGTVLSESEIEAAADFILSVQDGPMDLTEVETSYTLETYHYPLKVERLVPSGLSAPWGIEFVDENKALISQKNGQLVWMIDGALLHQPVANTPMSYGQNIYGGYMDIALDPEYAENGWVYLAFSHNSQNSLDSLTPGMTKIVRGRIIENSWVDEQELFEVHDSLKVSGGTRWGCRFLFDREGYLYFTIGDMNREDDSQILTRPAGKIYKINPDGSIPEDNPLVGQQGALQAIYSWGNRNAQGIALHPESGLIYASEHGPKGGDEINIIRKGFNYGWPVITYGIDYDDSIISDKTHQQGMEQPIFYWTPSIAVSAIEFVNGTVFPKWQNNLLVGALAFQEIRRLVIEEGKVIHEELLMKGYGRVRDIKQAPDGTLYLLTNAPDAVLRVTRDK